MKTIETTAMPPLRIHNQGDLPIYLQLKHQLAYQITTGRLPGGTRLPTVRALAAELNINQHTVGQAYRELQGDGLIESFTGRGSFVRQFDDVSAAESARLEQLTGLLRQARRRARAFGFSDHEIEQHLASLMRHEREPCRVVFVDHIPHIAQKYAKRLEHHLGDLVRAQPLLVADIEKASAQARRSLADSHYVFTFARNVPLLEQLIGDGTGEHEIVTIVSEVVPETTAILARLARGARTVVLAEERYVHAALDLLARHSPVDVGQVQVFTPEKLAGFGAAAKAADVVLYTFGVSSMLEGIRFDAPAHELVFDLSPDSVKKVRRMVG